MKKWDFPGGLGIKNLPCNVGNAGLIPGQGTKIPWAAWQGRKIKNSAIIRLFFNCT